MKISMEYQESTRGVLVYTIPNPDDLPDDFFDLRGYEQEFILEELGLVPDKTEHRSDYEAGDVWVSEP